jgi:hypothetical protein
LRSLLMALAASTALALAAPAMADTLVDRVRKGG